MTNQTETCSCTTLTGFKLMVTGDDRPFVCMKCNLPVAPANVPAHAEIAFSQWLQEYKSVHQLWLAGIVKHYDARKAQLICDGSRIVTAG